MNTENKPDPQSVIDETRKFWHGVVQDTVKNSVATIDETARQIITVVTILEGLYFHAITYSDLRGQQLSVLLISVYLGPLIFWLFSLISASLVFLPRIYSLNIFSSDAAKTLHENMLYRKYIFLLLSLLWVVIGSACLIGSIVVYLLG